MVFYSVTITASASITVESTTSAASAAAESASATAATAAWRAALPRTGLVDGQSSSINLAAVEGRNRRLCGLARVHFDKSEPA
jgi:hypothetical protein